MKNGKIEKGRHYCDPDLSWLHLSEEDVGKAYLGTGTKVVVE
jgi:hypothetical protein